MTKPFRITGPGKYRTRDGECAFVQCIDGHESYPCIGKIGDTINCWTAYGLAWSGKESPKDLVAPWTAKPKPRKRRTRDVRRWVIYWKSGHMDEQMHTAGERRRIGKSGYIAKWLPVVVKGVPVRK